MQSFFEYIPVQAAGGGKGDDKGRSGDKDKEGPVRTQMVGESPDDDLGYDPDTIPTEPIPDDDED